jgi:hypothetical protein
MFIHLFPISKSKNNSMVKTTPNKIETFNWLNLKGWILYHFQTKYNLKKL